MIADQIMARSHTKYVWRCPAGPDHVWKTTADFRTRLGTGCENPDTLAVTPYTLAVTVSNSQGTQTQTLSLAIEVQPSATTPVRGPSELNIISVLTRPDADVVKVQNPGGPEKVHLTFKYQSKAVAAPIPHLSLPFGVTTFRVTLNDKGRKLIAQARAHRLSVTVAIKIAGDAVLTRKLLFEARSSHATTPKTINAVVKAASLQTTPNWSGYVLPVLSPVTAVSGTWIVPKVDCGVSPNQSYVDTWVGVDGDNPGQFHLFQVGSDVLCQDGQQVNSLWWESISSSNLNDPNNRPHTLPGTVVRFGDTIVASVWEASPGQWAWTIYDKTTGSGSAVAIATVFYLGPATTAEWIVEDPGSPQVPFPRGFTPITFSNIGVQSASVLSNKAVEQPMLSGSGTLLATPSIQMDSAGNITAITVTHGS
jgi:hypothetical protein